LTVNFIRKFSRRVVIERVQSNSLDRRNISRKKYLV